MKYIPKHQNKQDKTGLKKCGLSTEQINKCIKEAALAVLLADTIRGFQRHRKIIAILTISVLVILLTRAIPAQGKQVTVYDYSEGKYKFYDIEQTGNNVEVYDYDKGGYKFYDVEDSDDRTEIDIQGNTNKDDLIEPDDFLDIDEE